MFRNKAPNILASHDCSRIQTGTCLNEPHVRLLFLHRHFLTSDPSSLSVQFILDFDSEMTQSLVCFVLQSKCSSEAQQVIPSTSDLTRVKLKLYSQTAPQTRHWWPGPRSSDPWSPVQPSDMIHPGSAQWHEASRSNWLNLADLFQNEEKNINGLDLFNIERQYKFRQ